ncbi:hypothetical protein JKP88DRAFT_262846 [Tribonema minus]|uniref:Uncharacterized protein n=1 Tax=Tribonema minus TaxID=303371 RepID=A0A835Z122_9STRA|nr:hypothetical protein JKP88DRAFT_262846 [Tribonema minus]
MASIANIKQRVSSHCDTVQAWCDELEEASSGFPERVAKAIRDKKFCLLVALCRGWWDQCCLLQDAATSLGTGLILHNYDVYKERTANSKGIREQKRGKRRTGESLDNLRHIYAHAAKSEQRVHEADFDALSTRVQELIEGAKAIRDAVVSRSTPTLTVVKGRQELRVRAGKLELVLRAPCVSLETCRCAADGPPCSPAADQWARTPLRNDGRMTAKYGGREVRELTALDRLNGGGSGGGGGGGARAPAAKAAAAESPEQPAAMSVRAIQAECGRDLEALQRNAAEFEAETAAAAAQTAAEAPDEAAAADSDSSGGGGSGDEARAARCERRGQFETALRHHERNVQALSAAAAGAAPGSAPALDLAAALRGAGRCHGVLGGFDAARRALERSVELCGAAPRAGSAAAAEYERSVLELGNLWLEGAGGRGRDAELREAQELYALSLRLCEEAAAAAAAAAAPPANSAAATAAPAAAAASPAASAFSPTALLRASFNLGQALHLRALHAEAAPHLERALAEHARLTREAELRLVSAAAASAAGAAARALRRELRACDLTRARAAAAEVEEEAADGGPGDDERGTLARLKILEGQCQTDLWNMKQRRQQRLARTASDPFAASAAAAAGSAPLLSHWSAGTAAAQSGFAMGSLAAAPPRAFITARESSRRRGARRPGAQLSALVNGGGGAAHVDELATPPLPSMSFSQLHRSAQAPHAVDGMTIRRWRSGGMSHCGGSKGLPDLAALPAASLARDYVTTCATDARADGDAAAVNAPLLRRLAAIDASSGRTTAVLDLSACAATEFDVAWLAQALAAPAHAGPPVALSLAGNPLSAAPAALSSAAAAQLLPRLVSLDLSRCGLRLCDLDVLPAGAAAMPLPPLPLQDLNLSDSWFLQHKVGTQIDAYTNGATCLGALIGRCRQLTRLELAGCCQTATVPDAWFDRICIALGDALVSGLAGHAADTGYAAATCGVDGGSGGGPLPDAERPPLSYLGLDRNRLGEAAWVRLFCGLADRAPRTLCLSSVHAVRATGSSSGGGHDNGDAGADQTAAAALWSLLRRCGPAGGTWQLLAPAAPCFLADALPPQLAPPPLPLSPLRCICPHGLAAPVVRAVAAQACTNMPHLRILEFHACVVPVDSRPFLSHVGAMCFSGSGSGTSGVSGAGGCGSGVTQLGMLRLRACGLGAAGVVAVLHALATHGAAAAAAAAARPSGAALSGRCLETLDLAHNASDGTAGAAEAAAVVAAVEAVREVLRTEVEKGLRSAATPLTLHLGGRSMEATAMDLRAAAGSTVLQLVL